MKRTSLAVCSLALCGGISVAVAWAQPTEQPGRPTAIQVRPATANEPPARELSPEEKAMEEAGAPDENHDKFEKFLGRWDATMKFWMGGEGEPMETTMSVITRWDPGMGKRYLIMDHNGKFLDRPFRGSSTWGYNKATKKYESVWRDSFSTGMMISYGEMSADGKTLTFKGENVDSMDGSPIKTREVYTWLSDDSYRFEMHEVRSGGQEHKVIEATYTKVQVGGRPGVNVRPVQRPNEQSK